MWRGNEEKSVGVEGAGEVHLLMHTSISMPRAAGHSFVTNQWPMTHHT